MVTCKHQVKSFFSSALFAITFFSIIGCGNDQSATKEIAVAQINPVESTKGNDTRFLVTAVEQKYEQILLSKLAQRRSTTPEVIELANLVEESNRETKSSLASLGIIKSIKVPAVPTQAAHAAYDTLNKSSVKEFDIAYIKLTIDGYNNAISLFEGVAHANIDPDIKSKAHAMLPEMRIHLSKAQALDAISNPISAVID